MNDAFALLTTCASPISNVAETLGARSNVDLLDDMWCPPNLHYLRGASSLSLRLSVHENPEQEYDAQGQAGNHHSHKHADLFGTTPLLFCVP